MMGAGGDVDRKCGSPVRCQAYSGRHTEKPVTAPGPRKVRVVHPVRHLPLSIYSSHNCRKETCKRDGRDRVQPDVNQGQS